MDPLSTNMTYLYLQLLKDSLNEFAYNADLAGLRWELANSKYGLSVRNDTIYIFIIDN